MASGPTPSLDRFRGLFPETVNEVAARVVAGLVATTAAVLLATGALWLLVPLAYGFWARVVAGPRYSPFALLATRVIAPRLTAHERIVAGPPKRFAQGIGAVVSTAALVGWALGATGVTTVLVAMLLVAASLEAALGFCLGCKVFGLGVRAGVFEESVCLDCSDITRRATA